MSNTNSVTRNRRSGKSRRARDPSTWKPAIDAKWRYTRGDLEARIESDRLHDAAMRLTTPMVEFQVPTRDLVLCSGQASEFRNTRQALELPFFAATDDPPKGKYDWLELLRPGESEGDFVRRMGRPRKFLRITPPQDGGRPVIKDEPIISLAYATIAARLRKGLPFSPRIRLVPGHYFEYIGQSDGQKNYQILKARIERLAGNMVDTNAFESRRATFSGYITNVTYDVPGADGREHRAIEFDLCNWMLDLQMALQTRTLNREYFALPPFGRRLYQLATFHVTSDAEFKIGRALLRYKMGFAPPHGDREIEASLDREFCARLARLEVWLRKRGGGYGLCGFSVEHDDRLVRMAKLASIPYD